MDRVTESLLNEFVEEHELTEKPQNSQFEHFAAFTGDTFYAHTDEEAAAKNPFFGGRVAHGYLVLAGPRLCVQRASPAAHELQWNERHPARSNRTKNNAKLMGLFYGSQ